MNLVEALNNYKSISILGMSKNTGKTVVLNELIELSRKIKKTVSLTSIGVDGETVDAVYKTKKPKIYAYEGTLIATAEATVNFSTAKFEILDILPFNTSLGRIMILKVIREGNVLLAGPDSNREIKYAVDKMLSFGGDVALIDGALNRRTQGSPSISDACILSTGASVSRDLNMVIKKTKHVVDMLSLDEIEYDIKQKIIKNNMQNILLIGQEIEDTNFKTALSNEDLIVEAILNSNIKIHSIFIPGSLTNSLLEKLIGLNVNIIVMDGTKVFVSDKEYRSFKAKGNSINVLDKINLIAVTQNPTSPFGYYFNPKVMMDELKKTLVNIDVFDVLYKGGGL